MKLFIVTVAALLAVVGQIHASSHFCYKGNPEEEVCGEEHWDGEFCQKGQQQSPIDIKSVDVSKTLKRVTFHFNADYKRGVSSSVITNNGHTVQVSATKDATSRMTLRPGSDSNDTYTFGQVHCHWSSEHQINSRAYDLECHFVHYNSKYDNITHAVTNAKSGALTIIGVLYEKDVFSYLKSDLVNSVFGVKDNRPMRSFTDNLESVKEPVAQPIETSTPFSPYDMINPENIELEAYNYMGSLTTPGCNEGMNWFVVKNVQKLSPDQWAKFERVNADSEKKETMKGNHRSLQPLNRRPITLVRIAPKVSA